MEDAVNAILDELEARFKIIADPLIFNGLIIPILEGVRINQEEILTKRKVL
jgi:hypothetical protein